MNEGKKFEQDFKKSLDQHKEKLWVYRPPDFGGGQAARFTNSSLCDYTVFNDSTQELYLLELKSTRGKSISCPSYSLISEIKNIRNDIETKSADDIKAAKDLLKEKLKKANSYDIKYHQIMGLYDIENSNYNHINAYFIINFREHETTYYCKASTILFILSETKKSSINMGDLEKINVKKIPQFTNRTRQYYDIGELLCLNKQG